MRIGVLSREYPPEVYGGAGVHVGELVPKLRELIDVEVHCFGAPRDEPDTYAHAAELSGAAALGTLATDVAMTAGLGEVALAHSHTWYANFAGQLAKLQYGVPHVITAHSLEPRRPWKAEQLGGGYRVSSWVERSAYQEADAIIAVSAGMRTDVLDCYPALDPTRVHVVHNGIDTAAYRPVTETGALRAEGIDPERPIVAFVGRITRQKGLEHLIAAAHSFADAQVVLCAGAPDTPEIAERTRAEVAALAAARDGVFWIDRMLTLPEVRQLLSAAAVFVCPSVYEPLGIVNLEAMACGAAVVASDVGGIPEVVAHNETGLLVHYDPSDVDGYRHGLAAAVNELLADRTRAKALGGAGRARAEAEFSWSTVAQQTVAIYRSLLD